MTLTLVLLALAAGAPQPAAAAQDDEPGEGQWAEDGSVFRDLVRLSADDPSADPVDWYRVNLTAGAAQLDLLRIHVNLTRNGGDQFLVWASVHDPDGALLTEVRATSFAVRSTATLCHRTGVYLVRVYTYSYFDCHYRIEFEIGQMANVTDGDDTLEQATFVDPPADVTGHLHGVLDPFDHYAVNLTRDAKSYEFVQARLTIAGTPVGRTDLDLFLIVRDDQGVPRVVSASTSNGSYEMAFYAATQEDQTVYIRCHAYGGNTSYSLNVTTVRVSDDGNNNIVRAEELEAVSSRDDSLNLTDRLDYFKVNMSGGDILWVSVTADGWDPGVRKPDLNIYLYSPSGLIINWSHSYDPHERASARAPDGDPAAWYYVLVTYFDRNPSDGIPAWGDYTINVTVDRAPRLVADLPLVVEEDGSLEVLLEELVEDEEGNLVQVRAQPANDVMAMVVGDRLMVIPATNFTGLTEFTLLASDDLRQVAISVPVEVTPVPDAPGLAPGSGPFQVDEDGQATVDLADVIVDGDGDNVTLTPLWDANHSLGASSLSGTSLTIVPEPDVFGDMTLPFRAEDGAGHVVTVELPVRVLPLPDPPRVLVADAELTVDEDTRGIEFDLTTMFMDPDGDPLTYHVTEATGNALFIVLDDLLVIDARPDFHGTATLVVEAHDGTDGVTARLHLTVLSVPDPPLVTDADPQGDVSMTEGDARTFTVTAQDVEGGTLTYSWYLDGVLVAGEGLPRFELVTNHSSQGSHLVTARVSNGQRDSFHNWSVEVSNVNRAPSLTLRRPRAGSTFTEGDNVVFEALAEDPDGDALSVQWISKGEVVGTGMSFATSDLKAGKHTFIARAVDPQGFATEANVTFEVEEPSGVPGAIAPAAALALASGALLVAAWGRKRHP